MNHVDDSIVSEVEADLFGTFLMMPECVLQAITLNKPGLRATQEAILFGLSLQCLNYRKKNLKRRGYIHYSEKDKEILRLYERHISTYCSQ